MAPVSQAPASPPASTWVCEALGGRGGGGGGAIPLAGPGPGLPPNLTARTARPVATATPADTLRGLPGRDLSGGRGGGGAGFRALFSANGMAGLRGPRGEWKHPHNPGPVGTLGKDVAVSAAQADFEITAEWRQSAPILVAFIPLAWTIAAVLVVACAPQQR